MTKALEKEIININEEKHKENPNLTAVHTSFRDALLNAIETNGIFSQLSENVKNINMGFRDLIISDKQKEFIELRKRQEEMIKQYSQIINNNMDNLTSNYNLELTSLVSSHISEIIGNLGGTSEILENFKTKLNSSTSHISELIKNLGNSSEIYGREILKKKTKGMMEIKNRKLLNKYLN